MGDGVIRNAGQAAGTVATTTTAATPRNLPVVVDHTGHMSPMVRDGIAAGAGAKGSAVAKHSFDAFKPGAGMAIVGGLGLNAGLSYLNGFRNTVGHAVFSQAIDRGNPLATSVLRRANTISIVSAVLLVGGLGVMAYAIHQKK